MQSQCGLETDQSGRSRCSATTKRLEKMAIAQVEYLQIDKENIAHCTSMSREWLWYLAQTFKRSAKD
jgi:hypothetical protein